MTNGQHLFFDTFGASAQVLVLVLAFVLGLATIHFLGRF